MTCVARYQGAVVFSGLYFRSGRFLAAHLGRYVVIPLLIELNPLNYLKWNFLLTTVLCYVKRCTYVEKNALNGYFERYL